MNIDERHLGLTPSNEEGLADNIIRRITDTVKQQVNLDQLVSIADSANAAPLSFSISRREPRPVVAGEPIKIGVFRDKAFGFYYPDDLEAMQALGAELVNIDSLSAKELPPVDGLFIGGGFPETQMETLSKNKSLLADVKRAIDQEMPVYAECGGLMFLARNILWNNQKYKMAGVIEGDIIMHEKPQGRGYIQLQENEQHPWPGHQNGNLINAHEFHYSELTNINTEYQYAYQVKRGHGIDGEHDGLIYKNLLANYAHLRQTSKLDWVNRFIEFIRNHKTRHHPDETVLTN
jgi:cobyrinic acid a,c-diamide synthase